ncbi:hypothetical protein DSL72_004381 [Monilinia vaccinii-corymbosi]|uniref:Arabinogalactan endo-beta-1,4-galactanase n=1 Tax=Monilinia vaccinii-corymbosi TaxID=61207 RepID=A0A8A3NWH3_9HELO|nr:hypothetical protein DSL72_004381 [Monilinia vaccinii-corymbosi]
MAKIMKLCAVLATVLPMIAQSATTGNDSFFFYKGHDLSSLPMLETDGYTFKDTARKNATRPVEAILGDAGMNTVKIREFVNPKDGTYGHAYNLKLAKRMFDQGYKISLTFHFSNEFADPGRQTLPEHWSSNVDTLAETLRKYVKDRVISYHRNGIDLDILCLGNEIRYGMTWPAGFCNIETEPAADRYATFANLAKLWLSARAGVDDAVAAGANKPQVMIHIDNGWDLWIQSRWFEAFTANNVSWDRWDVFGFSFYPYYQTGATFEALRNSLTAMVQKYNKPVQIVETDYPAICDGKFSPIPPSSEPSIPYSVEGQLTWVRKIFEVLKGLPNGMGRGIHYWEPAWLNNTSLGGSGCNDVILFEGHWNGNTAVGYSRKSVNMFK